MLHPHVPEDLKHFGKHLFATFLGLLMALALESWHQSHQHAKTAEFARTFITRELEANRAEVKVEMESIHREGPKILNAIKALEQRVGEAPAEPKCELPKEQFALSLATLPTSSWEASVATQSFSYMEPWRVEKIAQAFTIQRSLQNTHTLLVPRLFSLSRLSPVVAGQIRLDQVSQAQASAILGDLREAMIALNSAYTTAKELDQAMAEAIKACRP